jgi:hypothetical protein
MISQLLQKATNFTPALQRPQIPRLLMKAVPPLGASAAAATAPSQLVLRYRLPDQVPSFCRYLQSMDESGRGPRTAEAVASPLAGQPTINSAGVSSSMGQSLGMMQL